MPSAVPIFLKMADEKQVIYFTWPNEHTIVIEFKYIENVSYTLSEQKYFNTVKSTCTNRVIYRLNIEL